MADAMLYQFFPPSGNPAGPPPSVMDLPYAAYRDVKHVELSFADGLHRQLGQKDYFSGDMSAFFVAQAQSPSPAETILRARATRDFDTPDEFLAACSWPPGSKHLEIWECVHILSGGLNLDGYTYTGVGEVVVDSGTLSSNGAVAQDMPDGLPSLVTFATLSGDLQLAGGMRHDGYWMAPNGSLSVPGGSNAQIYGSLALGKLTPDMLGSGLAVNFTSQGDPTRTDDPKAPRYVDYYMVGMGQVPMSVDRL